MMALRAFLVFGVLVCNAVTQHQTHQQQTAPIGGTPHAAQVPPPLRFCRCDELEQCYKDQTTQYKDLTQRCQRECGAALLPNETIEHVANCYQAYEQSRRDQKTNKHRCVENLVSRPCLTDQNQQPPPSQATLTVDPIKFVQKRTKRNYKLAYPSQLNMYSACVKTCRKNRGVVQFNLDGTPVKPAATKNQAGSQQQAVGTNPNVIQKPGKGYAACAVQLGCQLVPIDKQMQKQAKEICKYQNAQVEDHDLKLCQCLEGALNQNFLCTPTIAADTCSSSQSGENAGCSGSGTY